MSTKSKASVEYNAKLGKEAKIIRNEGAGDIILLNNIETCINKTSNIEHPFIHQKKDYSTKSRSEINTEWQYKGLASRFDTKYQINLLFLPDYALFEISCKGNIPEQFEKDTKELESRISEVLEK